MIHTNNIGFYSVNNVITYRWEKNIYSAVKLLVRRTETTLECQNICVRVSDSGDNACVLAQPHAAMFVRLQAATSIVRKEIENDGTDHKHLFFLFFRRDILFTIHTKKTHTHKRIIDNKTKNLSQMEMTSTVWWLGDWNKQRVVLPVAHVHWGIARRRKKRNRKYIRFPIELMAAVATGACRKKINKINKNS